jgi:replicative DNA helicase
MTVTADPARALVGAALHGAPGVLELIRDDDLADPRLRVVAGVVRQLAEAGATPDPTTVLAHARATGTVTRAAAVQAFALLLHELTTECPVPASARFYAVAVRDEVIRRRCAELAARIGPAAVLESLGSLRALVDAEHRAVRELADRRTAIAGAPPRLPAVSA